MRHIFLFLLFFSVAAVPPGGTEDEDESDGFLHGSELIARANDGLDNLIHHDIMPHKKKNLDSCKHSGCKWPKKGKFVTVPYSISKAFNKKQRSLIIRSLRTFHHLTCIRFVEKKPWHRHYIRFIDGSGCWSYLGRQKGRQTISLKKKGCMHDYTVQHEILHSLGFHHEHVRSDRDRYVRIHHENIQPGKESNFKIVPTNNLGTHYNFSSIMHYSSNAFSVNGKPTIVVKKDPRRLIRHSKRISTTDILRVNKLYKCRR